MKKKERCMSILCFVFSIFLFLCAVIEFTIGHIGAAIGNLGAGFYFLSIFFVSHKKSKKASENNL